jgi:hypothetical protein
MKNQKINRIIFYIIEKTTYHHGLMGLIVGLIYIYKNGFLAFMQNMDDISDKYCEDEAKNPWQILILLAWYSGYFYIGAMILKLIF